MSRHTSLENTWKVRFRDDGMVKTAFVVALDHKHAERLADSFPNVIGVSKATRDYFRIEQHEITRLSTELIKDIAQPKMTPLAMDEFLWMRRNKRVENKNKDRQID